MSGNRMRWACERRVDGWLNIRLCVINKRMEQVNVFAVSTQDTIVKSIADMLDCASDKMKPEGWEGSK